MRDWIPVFSGMTSSAPCVADVSSATRVVDWRTKTYANHWNPFPPQEAGHR
jgi:hypothetical protein